MIELNLLWLEIQRGDGVYGNGYEIVLYKLAGLVEFYGVSLVWEYRGVGFGAKCDLVFIGFSG